MRYTIHSRSDGSPIVKNASRHYVLTMLAEAGSDALIRDSTGAEVDVADLRPDGTAMVQEPPQRPGEPWCCYVARHGSTTGLAQHSDRVKCAATAILEHERGLERRRAAQARAAMGVEL